jgi:hypothetical protein
LVDGLECAVEAQEERGACKVLVVFG